MGGRGGRGGGIENANPAGIFPPIPYSPVSYPLMQNIELKEVIWMYAEIGKCGAWRKKKDYWGWKCAEKQQEQAKIKRCIN